MNIATLQTEVYNLTNRPDLVSQTLTAIRKATMKCHLADEFRQDLQIAIITVPVQTDFHYLLDLTNTTSYPNLRRVAYIKEYNSVIVGNEIQFTKLYANALLDEYKLERTNYWYQAGMAVTIGSYKQLVQVSVAYHKYPSTDVATYSSWIADQYPDAIIQEAASTVFKTIGKSDEAKLYQQYFAENLQFLRQIGL